MCYTRIMKVKDGELALIFLGAIVLIIFIDWLIGVLPAIGG